VSLTRISKFKNSAHSIIYNIKCINVAYVCIANRVCYECYDNIIIIIRIIVIYFEQIRLSMYYIIIFSFFNYAADIII
jgi:hypothetical protein